MTRPIDEVVKEQRGPKLCRDCGHYRPDGFMRAADICAAPQAKPGIDKIDGSRHGPYCNVERVWTCGPTAKWFKAKEMEAA